MAKKTNCTKNGKEYYRITATVGYNEKGKPVPKEFYGSCKSNVEKNRICI